MFIHKSNYYESDLISYCKEKNQIYYKISLKIYLLNQI